MRVQRMTGSYPAWAALTMGAPTSGEFHVWPGNSPGSILDRVDFLGGLIGESLGRTLRRLRADRRLRSGRLECSLRVVSGPQDGLSRRWRHVVAAVSPGRLEFCRYWPWFSGSQTIDIVSLHGPPRRPSSREWWLSLAPTCRVVEVHTPTAVVEWAVLDHYLPWTLDRLRTAPAGTADGSAPPQPS
jgi:hypothetical protein